MLAAAYYGCGGYKEAIAAAREVLQYEQDNLDALLIVAGANLALDGIDDARNDSREALASNPDFTLKKYAAIQPYKESQILDKVMDMLQKAGLE